MLFRSVDISSDIIITETVDTSKYAVSISKKEENDKYSNPGYAQKASRKKNGF